MQADTTPTATEPETDSSADGDAEPPDAGEGDSTDAVADDTVDTEDTDADDPSGTETSAAGRPDDPSGTSGTSAADPTTTVTTPAVTTGREADRSTSAPATTARAGAVFSEDFADAGSLARFDFDVYHRDDFVNADNTSWAGDHPITGPNDLCGAPEEKRTITRGQRSAGFNSEWIYRCVPGGDVDKAHLMTSIGDTSGYSIGSFSPRQTFEGIREIRWDVNITDLGVRQFTEVKVIPVESYDLQNLPCAIEWLPCDTDTHGQLGSVGVSFFNHEMAINAGGGEEKLSGDWGLFCSVDDPALSSIRTRRTHIVRDDGDGTLSFSIMREDGTFHTVDLQGSFPSGKVKVVFADHNYTPDKDGVPISHTWHWDNIQIIG